MPQLGGNNKLTGNSNRWLSDKEVPYLEHLEITESGIALRCPLEDLSTGPWNVRKGMNRRRGARRTS